MIESVDIRKLMFWLKVKETHTGNFPSCVDDLILQMHKSALFQRLMEGKAPLPEPPPLTFGKPWYSLIENGIGYPQDVFKSEGFEIDLFGEAIVIDQFAWNLMEEVSEENWVVNYNFGPDKENVTNKKWNVFRHEIGSWIIKIIN